MSNFNLHHFETFLLVAECESFTAAAKQLSISKAAVSHSVRILEESLQTSLFIRSTRKVSLTEEGELLFTQCKRIKTELDIARGLVDNFNSSPSGTLKISCNPYLSEAFLLDKLQQYLEDYPKVHVEVIAEERMPDMDREQIDIVFGVNWPAPPDVIARVIGETRYVLCASKAYLEKFTTPKNIKELEQHHYIPHLGRTKSNTIVNLKKPINFSVECRLKLNNAQLMKQSALKGFGIVQLHEYMVKEELASGELIEVLQDYSRPQVPLYIYYQKHRFVQPKVRNFVNMFFNPK